MAVSTTKQVRKARVEGCFYSPFIDFMLLGGASLIALPLIAFIFSDDTHIVLWSVFLFGVSHVINSPHFAHSYQIFYRNFRQKLRGDGLPRSIHLRYIFSGIIFPILFILFYGYALWKGDLLLIGNSVNIMLFFVGWHYVKQGYGLVIVCSVLKKNFFAQQDKNILLLNAYLVWAATWVSANLIISKGDYFGLEYYTFDVPDILMTPLLLAVLLSTLGALWVFLRKYKETKGQKPFPFNGVVAYVAAIYSWTLFSTIHPFYLLIIPAFHSLQYLAVVWRYEYNRLRDTDENFAAMNPLRLKFSKAFASYFKKREQAALFSHVIASVVLGSCGFYLLPTIIQNLSVYMQLNIVNIVPEAAVFMVIFWVFINVHHYFIDNVIWKKENPEIKEHLFS